MTMARILATASGAAIMALAACSSPAERQADRLDEAAVQADPAAAPVMTNAADRIRQGDTETGIADPNSPAQQALENAGQAQLDTPPAPRP